MGNGTTTLETTFRYILYLSLSKLSKKDLCLATNVVFLSPQRSIIHTYHFL